MINKALTEAVQTCKACPLGVRGAGVSGIWVLNGIWKDADPRIMVIGEAPGAVEQVKGEPFVGDSGQLLRSLLTECGIENYYLTNLAKHWPFKNQQGKQQPPDKVVIQACAPFLEYELSLVKPNKVIILGKVAAKRLLQLPGDPSAESLVGRVWEFPYSTTQALVLYHPAYFLHSRTAPWVQKKLNDWKRALTNFMGARPEPYRIEQVVCEVHSNG